MGAANSGADGFTSFGFTSDAALNASSTTSAADFGFTSFGFTSGRENSVNDSSEVADSVSGFVLTVSVAAEVALSARGSGIGGL